MLRFDCHKSVFLKENRSLATKKTGRFLNSMQAINIIVCPGDCQRPSWTLNLLDVSLMKTLECAQAAGLCTAKDVRLLPHVMSYPMRRALRQAHATCISEIISVRDIMWIALSYLPFGNDSDCPPRHQTTPLSDDSPILPVFGNRNRPVPTKPLVVRRLSWSDGALYPSLYVMGWPVVRTSDTAYSTVEYGYAEKCPPERLDLDEEEDADDDTAVDDETRAKRAAFEISKARYEMETSNQAILALNGIHKSPPAITVRPEMYSKLESELKTAETLPRVESGIELLAGPCIVYQFNVKTQRMGSVDTTDMRIWQDMLMRKTMPTSIVELRSRTDFGWCSFPTPRTAEHAQTFGFTAIMIRGGHRAFCQTPASSYDMAFGGVKQKEPPPLFELVRFQTRDQLRTTSYHMGTGNCFGHGLVTRRFDTVYVSLKGFNLFESMVSDVQHRYGVVDTERYNVIASKLMDRAIYGDVLVFGEDIAGFVPVTVDRIRIWMNLATTHRSSTTETESEKKAQQKHYPIVGILQTIEQTSAKFTETTIHARKLEPFVTEALKSSDVKQQVIHQVVELRKSIESALDVVETQNPEACKLEDTWMRAASRLHTELHLPIDYVVDVCMKRYLKYLSLHVTRLANNEETFNAQAHPTAAAAVAAAAAASCPS